MSAAVIAKACSGLPATPRPPAASFRTRAYSGVSLTTQGTPAVMAVISLFALLPGSAPSCERTHTAKRRRFVTNVSTAQGTFGNPFIGCAQIVANDSPASVMTLAQVAMEPKLDGW